MGLVLLEGCNFGIVDFHVLNRATDIIQAYLSIVVLVIRGAWVFLRHLKLVRDHRGWRMGVLKGRYWYLRNGVRFDRFGLLLTFLKFFFIF